MRGKRRTRNEVLLKFKWKEVGANVKELRSQKGYTAEELGAKAGISASRVVEVEEGDPSLDLTLVQKFANASGVKVSKLLE